MSRLSLIGLSFGSGALAALGHAPFGLWYVGLAGFIGLAYLVSRASRPTLAAWAGGAGYFALALHWIVEPFLVDAATHGWMAPFALFLLAGGLALFWALAGWASARHGGNKALGWALCLTAAEFARGHVFTGFPWALPAYIWAESDLRMLASLVGPYGLTLLTLGFASMVVMDWGRMRPRTGFGLVISAVVFTFVSAQLAGEPVLTDKTVRLVQPNAPQHEKWHPEKAHGFVERALDFTATPKNGIDMIVWPETAIPYPLDVAAPAISRIAAAANGVPVLTGLNRRTPEGSWFNSSVLINDKGLVAETYDKVHLVPFGEYIPLKIDFIRALAVSTGYGFSSGEAVRAIDTPLGPTVPLICYEVIFPQHARDVNERQSYLLQITNDAWFGGFSGPYQHLDQARFRAVEQGLPLIRAANTGISAVIGPHGLVLDWLALGEAGYLDAALPKALPPTLYSRTGDWPVIVFLLLAISAHIATRKRDTIANGSTSS